MSAHADPAAELTANERWKQGWEQVFWKSMIVAIVAHFAVFQFWPSMVAADISPDDQFVTQTIAQPPTELPPPPQEIAAPATPIIAQTVVSEDVTIQETTFDGNPPDNFLRPPPSSGTDSVHTDGFTAFEVLPLLTNQRESSRPSFASARRPFETPRSAEPFRLCSRLMPRKVLSTEVGTSSGYPRLDEAALRVADLMKFSPAMNRDVAVPVRVTFPISFQVPGAVTPAASPGRLRLPAIRG